MSEHKKLVRLIARAFYSGDCPPKSAAAPQPRGKAEKVPPLLPRHAPEWSGHHPTHNGALMQR